MNYSVVITPMTVRDLERLDSETKARIGQRLKFFLTDPLRHARNLSDPRIGSYRFRVGDYRILFDIVDQDIVVLRVGHRREIYR